MKANNIVRKLKSITGPVYCFVQFDQVGEWFPIDKTMLITYFKTLGKDETGFKFFKEKGKDTLFLDFIRNSHYW